MQEPLDNDAAEATVVPAAVRQRFRHRLEAVESLFRASEEFRDICSDYHECIETLKRFEAGEGGSGQNACIADYRSLHEELAREIIGCLSAARSVDFRREATSSAGIGNGS